MGLPQNPEPGRVTGTHSFIHSLIHMLSACAVPGLCYISDTQMNQTDRNLNDSSGDADNKHNTDII